MAKIKKKFIFSFDYWRAERVKVDELLIGLNRKLILGHHCKPYDVHDDSADADADADAVADKL